MKDKLYRRIACALVAYENCLGRGNMEWAEKHKEALETLIAEHLPSGSGIDNGVKLDYGKSSAERLVLQVAYHAMDQYGGYCGWYDYTIIVKPSLVFGFELRVKGRDYNGTKDYLADIFGCALSAEIE